MNLENMRLVAAPGTKPVPESVRTNTIPGRREVLANAKDLGALIGAAGEPAVGSSPAAAPLPNADLVDALRDTIGVLSEIALRVPAISDHDRLKQAQHLVRGVIDSLMCLDNGARTFIQPSVLDAVAQQMLQSIADARTAMRTAVGVPQELR